MGFSATMLIILTLIVGAEFHLRHRGKPSQADKIEFVLTIVFAVQLPSFFNLFIQIAQSSGADGYGGGGEPSWLSWSRFSSWSFRFSYSGLLTISTPFIAAHTTASGAWAPPPSCHAVLTRA